MPNSTHRLKTLSFFSTLWLGTEPEGGLEGALRQALRMMSDALGTKVILPSGVSGSILNRKLDETGRLFLHVAFVEEQASVSTVPDLSPGQVTVELSSMPPPARNEFLEGDVFLLIAGNSIVSTSSRINSSSAIYYLREVISKTLGSEKAKFDTHLGLDKKVATILLQEGVREIVLRVAASESDLIKESIIDLMSEDTDLGTMDKANTLTKAVSFKAGLFGKMKAHGYSLLAQHAQRVIDSPGGVEFSIITKSGNKITSDEITLKQKSEIRKSGSTLDRGHAWEKLGDFWRSLEHQIN